MYFLHVKLSVQYITAGYPQPREKVFSISGNKSIRRSPISQQHATCIYCTVFSRVLKYWALHVAVQPYCFRFQGVNNVKKKKLYMHMLSLLSLYYYSSCHSIPLPKVFYRLVYCLIRALSCFSHLQCRPIFCADSRSVDL